MRINHRRKRLPAFSSFLFSFFLYSISVFAQKSFVPAYVLLNSGDTVKGLIDDKEWKVNPKSVDFKKTGSRKITTYTPLQIHSFQIQNGDWYFSFVGMVDHSSWSTEMLDYNALPDTSLDTLFLRVLVAGKATLFASFDDGQRRHFYMMKDGGEITELYCKKYLCVTQGKATTSEDAVCTNEFYKSQLVNELGDCLVIASKFISHSPEYSEKDLAKTFMEYNSCFDGQSTYMQKKDKWKVEGVILGGINSSSLKFFISDVPSRNTVNHTGYAFALAANFRLPRLHHAVSIYPELLIKNYNGSTEITTGIFNDLTDTVTFKFVYLKLSMLLRYQVMTVDVKPFFEIGISNDLALQKSSNISDFYTYNTDLRPFNQGLVAGVGVSFLRLQAEVRMEFSNDFMSNENIGSGFKTFYALLGYAF